MQKRGLQSASLFMLKGKTEKEEEKRMDNLFKAVYQQFMYVATSIFTVHLQS